MMPVHVYTLALALTTLAAPTVAVLTCGAGPGGRIVQVRCLRDDTRVVTASIKVNVINATY